MALFDLSFHMSDTFIEGPDATKLLSAVSANNYEKFALGQAKQFVPVSYDGNIITDGILMRTAEQGYTLTGPPASQSWVKYHGAAGGYDVALATDPDSSVRTDRDPKLFRFQVQGSLALEVVERVLGVPVPDVKFFHSAMLKIAGRPVRALRHGMAGQAGFELIGDFADYGAVKDALLAAREEVPRVKVTLELDRDDVRRVLGDDLDYLNTYSRFHIERGGRLSGMTFWTSNIAPVGTVLALSLVSSEDAEAGTEVEVVWGDQPGDGTDTEADLGLPRIRAR